jgi:DNA processing protein
MMLFQNSTEYPPFLREIPDPPDALYLRGTMPKTARPPFAIVGTRRATPTGIETARRFGRELAAAGFPIVSGLALGIDAAAHEGCLETPNGIAIAVLAGGLNKIYPGENQKLGERILERGGVIISEYPEGTPPYKDHFLRRNRIVSGLSRGVLIIEAPENSGSLATARHAMDQNRDLFVVPGTITHGNFKGSHQLIRQGATLVTAPEEILEEYGVTREEKIARDIEAASDEEKQILNALREHKAPAEVDKIISMTKLEPRVVTQKLSFLTLRGLVREVRGGYTI